MSHDEGNPFDKATGEYLQEETSKPDITSDLNSTPAHKADELAEKAKAEGFNQEPAQVVEDVKPAKRTVKRNN